MNKQQQHSGAYVYRVISGETIIRHMHHPVPLFSALVRLSTVSTRPLGVVHKV